MSVEDDFGVAFFSSITSNSYSNTSELSLEDAAWVDSCLVQDPELSESSWNAVKDALLDIISSEPYSSFTTNVGGSENSETSTSRDVLMSEEVEMTQDHVAEEYGNDAAKADKEEMDLIKKFLLKDMSEYCGQQEGERAEVGLDISDESYMDFLMNKDIGKLESLDAVDGHKPFKADDADKNEASVSEKEEMGMFRGFLSKNKSKIRQWKQDKVEEVDLDLNLTDEIEQLPDDIFKVWDLETPADDEDVLVKQLEKALTESTLTTQPLAASNRNDFNIGALDSLISGIADLSLDPIMSS